MITSSTTTTPMTMRAITGESVAAAERPSGALPLHGAGQPPLKIDEGGPAGVGPLDRPPKCCRSAAASAAFVLCRFRVVSTLRRSAPEPLWPDGGVCPFRAD